MNKDPYTRVPNLVYDIVGPLLSSAERDCLFYVVRRTWGFPDANGAPKARDTIGLDQFENGICSGDTLLDLGTQLSRNTIKKALQGLERKELVEVRYSCTHCLWEQGRGDPEPAPSSGRGHHCPRCRASLSRAWALADLTPRKLTGLLNKYDRLGREWRWDTEQRRFHFSNPEEDEKKRRSREDLQAEIERLRNLVWYPEIVDELIKQANSQIRSGKGISLSRQLNTFWKPVWELQETHPSPPLVRYAMEQTLKARIVAQPKNHRWFRYMQVVAKNSNKNFAPDPKARPGSGSDPREHEQQMRGLLRRAATLNGSGEAEQARALLSDILAQVESLAPLFAGDQELCETSLREAFKQGSSDFVGIRPDPYGLDFYPEWSWPDE